MSPVLLHVLHASVLVVAGVVVLAMMAPSRSHAAARLRTVAARGELVTRAEARAHRVLTVRDPRRDPSLSAFVLGTLVGAVVHGAVCPEHFEEGLRFGLFFLVVTVVQFALAIAVARGRRHRALTASILVNAGCIALWMITRTVGLPFGLAEVEPVGVWDTLASAAEFVAVAAAVALRPRSAFALVTVRVPSGV